jgi:hypothetical protein
MPARTPIAVALVVVGLMLIAGRLTAQSQPSSASASEPASASPGDALVLAEFDRRVEAHMALHRKAVEQGPAMPKEASLEEIDRSQRALLARLSAARAGARRGDVFTPPMEALVRRLLAEVFAGPEGTQLLRSIMDENPEGVTIAVNGRYPDDVPMATMPPDVLAALPKLPDGLEYRFVGAAFTIVDVPAHLIVDFIPDTLPR